MGFKFNPFSGVLDWVVNRFLDLTDTPDTFTNPYELLQVNSTNDSLEFTNAPQNIAHIDFNLTTTPATQEGRLYWNNDEGALEVGMKGSDVNLQIGLENIIRGRNNEGAPIPNGSAVRISGSTGVQPQAVLVNSDEEISPCTIAVSTEDIADNGFGYFTTFGLVRELDTSLLTEGSVIYLGTTDNTFVDVMPDPPYQVIKIGYCIISHAVNGVIFVNIQSNELIRDRKITKEPTGFTHPSSVIVTSNGLNDVTLTGVVDGYYEGQRATDFFDGYTSPILVGDTTKNYFLTYNGIDIAWRDISAYPNFFSDLLISFAFYDANNANWVFLHETHGLMPWTVHQQLHQTMGTYKRSGGNLSDYTLNSTVDRRPNVSSTTIKNEDLETTLSALTTKSYTQLYNTGTGLTNFVLAQSDIIPLLENNPYYNSFDEANWGQTLLPDNSVATVWLFAIPVAKGSSQGYRYLWCQPQWFTQAANPSAGALTQARTIEELRLASELNLTQLNDLSPEFVAVTRVTIQYTSNNWTIQNVISITGNRFSQTQTPAGNFLSVVSSDEDQFSGVGTPSDPLTLTGKRIQFADNTDLASINNLGSFRFRQTATENFLDICMQTNVAQFNWVNVLYSKWS